MHSDIELLLKLQTIDYDLGELERSKLYLPDMMTTLQREMGDAAGKLQAARATLEEKRLRQKTIDLEIKSRESELARYQQQMMAIKTNKEYDALVATIDAAKTAKSALETEQLQLLDQMTSLEQELGVLTEREAQIVEANTKQLALLQEKIDTIGEKVLAKETSRNEVVVGISKPNFAIYERVRKGKGGKVVNAVKRRACGACFKALTPKKVQDVKRADRIHTCDACGTLLYWDDVESN